MSGSKEYTFEIKAYTPETFPMGRLAEYMQDLAALLGERASVHFVDLVPGSTGLVHTVDAEAVPKVERRVAEIGKGSGTAEAIRAFARIEERLIEDAASAQLIEGENGQLLVFPGATKSVPQTFGPFNITGTLDGKVSRVGGKSDPVPVMLETREGFETHCYAARMLAKKLGNLLFESEIRFMGTGRWLRDNTGTWRLQRFTITDFVVLDEKPLMEVVSNLRSVKGAAWQNDDDPWAALRAMRESDEVA